MDGVGDRKRCLFSFLPSGFSPPLFYFCPPLLFALCSTSGQSYPTALAAFLPGVPITPPPGCVPAPHIYNPSTGVRGPPPGVPLSQKCWSSPIEWWKKYFPQLNRKPVPNPVGQALRNVTNSQ